MDVSDFTKDAIIALVCLHLLAETEFKCAWPRHPRLGIGHAGLRSSWEGLSGISERAAVVVLYTRKVLLPMWDVMVARRSRKEDAFPVSINRSIYIPPNALNPSRDPHTHASSRRCVRDLVDVVVVH
jgi:hypothetical protein